MKAKVPLMTFFTTPPYLHNASEKFTFIGMKRKDNKSHCPINFTLEKVGDPWSLLILRDILFFDKKFYNDFLDSGEKISTNILSARLKELTENGILIHLGRKQGYTLSKTGVDLIPILLEMILWGAKYDENTDAPQSYITKLKQDKSGHIKMLEAKFNSF